MKKFAGSLVIVGAVALTSASAHAAPFLILPAIRTSDSDVRTLPDGVNKFLDWKYVEFPQAKLDQALSSINSYVSRLSSKQLTPTEVSNLHIFENTQTVMSGNLTINDSKLSSRLKECNYSPVQSISKNKDENLFVVALQCEKIDDLEQNIFISFELKGIKIGSAYVTIGRPIPMHFDLEQDPVLRARADAVLKAEEN